MKRFTCILALLYTVAAPALAQSATVVTPLDAIRIYYAHVHPQWHNLRVESLVQAGDSIIASVGWKESGSMLLLKRQPGYGWTVVGGEGGMLTIQRGRALGMSESDIANFSGLRFGLAPPGAGIAPAQAPRSAPAYQVLAPNAAVTITDPQADVQRLHLPPP